MNTNDAIHAIRRLGLASNGAHISGVDEDEVAEFMTDGATYIIPIGLEHALARNLGAYLADRITVEEFEVELERLMRKREAITTPTTEGDR
jgi:hypothetical protein